MALFPQYTRDFNFKGKTFTNLVISEGDAPAEKLIPAAEENKNVKFQYSYGPLLSGTTNEQNVVIPKGKILEAGVPEWDFETEHMVQTVKIAQPGSMKALGVNHHNVYQRIRDRYAGNPVTVITRNYIEVPYIDTTGLDATGQSKLLNSINYGVAYGAGPLALQPGDFVKAGEYGNYVKFDPEVDNFASVIGQAWAVETELPPAGFLQYFMDIDDSSADVWDQLVKNAGYAPAPGTVYYNQGGQKVNMAGSYGNIAKDVKMLPYKGIPFLTDGYFKAKTEVTGMVLDNDGAGVFTDGRVEYVRINDTNSLTLQNDGTVLVSDYRKAMITIKLKDKLAAIGDGKVVVTIGGVAYDSDVNPNIVHVNHYDNTITLYFYENFAVAKDISIDATMIVNPVAGVPTGWDFEKSMGAVRILLSR